MKSHIHIERVFWSVYRRVVRAGHGFRGRASERGDVPGWVLITLMTAGLVIALWALAGPMLGKIFTDAVSGVKGP